MAKTEKKCNYCGKVFLAENKEINRGMLNIVHYLVLQKQKKQNNLNLFVNIVVNSLLDIMLQLNIVRCLVNKNIIELNKRLTTQKI